MHVSLCCTNIYFSKQCLVKKVIPKYANLKFTNNSAVSQGTQRHVHFIHGFIKNVSVWDPTAQHFKHC